MATSLDVWVCGHMYAQCGVRGISAVKHTCAVLRGNNCLLLTSHQSGKCKRHVMVKCMVLGFKAIHKLNEIRDAGGSFLVVACHSQQLQSKQSCCLKAVDVMAETAEEHGGGGERDHSVRSRVRLLLQCMMWTVHDIGKEIRINLTPHTQNMTLPTWTCKHPIYWKQCVSNTFHYHNCW